MEKELEVIFARERLRLTTPRRIVFLAMHESNTPVSAASIAQRCKDIDRVSVYRTIDLFVRLGIAEAVPLGWKRRYELTGPFKSHHHHLSCRKCGTLIDVHSQKFEHIVAAVAKEHGFHAEDHTFEIRGLCANCK